MAVLGTNLLYDFPRMIRRAVIYKENFIREILSLHDLLDPLMEFRKGFFFVE